MERSLKFIVKVVQNFLNLKRRTGEEHRLVSKIYMNIGTTGK